jgi:hypothetical protein
MNTRRPPHRQSRSVVLVFAAVAVLLGGVIIGMSLSARAPALPSIAEFAPQAVSQLTAPPRQQESGGQSGTEQAAASSSSASPTPTPSRRTITATSSAHPSKSGASSSSSATASATTSASASTGASSTAKVIDKTRVKQCNAKTQTANPQSATCNNYDPTTDNGGATAQGITQDTVRVGYIPNGVPSGGDTLTALVDYFNQHYQFYGRTISLVPFATNLDASSNDPAVENAAAADAAALNLFAVLGPTSQAVDWSAFYDRMAAAHVITIPFTNELGRTAAEFAANAPYEWSFYPATDVEEQALANWACTSLAGHAASFGGPDVSSSQRKFGVLIQQTAGSPVASAALTQNLASCGHAAAAAVTIDPSTGDHTTMQSALARLQSAGVTSVVLLGDFSLINSALTNAAPQGYYPEWINPMMGSYSDNDFKLKGQIDDQLTAPPLNYAPELPHMFGLWPDNRPIEYSNAWWTQAVLEADPSFSSSYAEQWVDQEAATYSALQILANGIQNAGPKLTPDSFATGLMTITTSAGGQAPYYAAGYGFGAGDYSASSNYAVVWWSKQPWAFNYVQTKPATGSFCFVGGGARYAPGNWPSLSALFNPSAGCR